MSDFNSKYTGAEVDALLDIVANSSTPTPPTPDMPVIGDGKTYLYIKIAAEGRMTVPLYFSQSVARGVGVDWGDGSIEDYNKTGNITASHTYAEIGEYTIRLMPLRGCTLGLGHNSSSYCVMGSVQNNNIVYLNMLQAVEIGSNVATIGSNAFSNCHSLSSIVIPESVTSIGTSAFQKCYSLSSIVIPEGVTVIDSNAFYYCYSLSSIVIPESVTSIGTSAFSYCLSLSSIVIPEGVTSIGNYAFNYCYSLSSIVIPKGVATIGNNAFYYCYSLSSIVIPERVTTVGNYAFYYCCGMAYYDFSQCLRVPRLQATNAFQSISSDCKIVVPDALYDSWIGTTNWATYASQIIKASEFNS